MTGDTLAPVLRVLNVAAAIPWYQRLGFGVEYEHSSGPDLRHTVAVLKRGELVLMLSNREEDGAALAFFTFAFAMWGRSPTSSSCRCGTWRNRGWSGITSNFVIRTAIESES